MSSQNTKRRFYAAFPSPAIISSGPPSAKTLAAWAKQGRTKLVKISVEVVDLTGDAEALCPYDQPKSTEPCDVPELDHMMASLFISMRRLDRRPADLPPLVDIPDHFSDDVDNFVQEAGWYLDDDGSMRYFGMDLGEDCKVCDPDYYE